MNPDFFVSFPGLGIQDLPIAKVAFNVFGWPIYWYGLLIAGAIVLCMLLSMRQAPRFGLTADDVMDTFIGILPLMLIFARVYYIAFSWQEFAHDWKRIFDTRSGGLAFYGGVIGGVLAIFLVARIKKMAPSRLFDFLVVYVPLGQAIGRWGNFVNQEAFGNNTRLPWGMISNGTQAYLTAVNLPGVDPNQPVHPTFFYEFVANLVIFAILLKVRKRSKTPWVTLLSYLLLYGLVRFFVEGIRTDPLLVAGTSVRVSQLLSALMVVGSLLALLVLSRRRRQRELIAALYGTDDRSGSAEEAGAEDRVFIADEPDAAEEPVRADAADEAAGQSSPDQDSVPATEPDGLAENADPQQEPVAPVAAPADEKDAPERQPTDPAD